MADESVSGFNLRTVLSRFVLYALVLLIGAAIFMELEKQPKNSNSDVGASTERKLRVAAKYNMSEEDLAFIETLIKSEFNEKSREEELSQWNYGSTMFFTFTVMTTIGYGHMTPQTWQGRLFCIFFSLIAIPVTGLMLASVGNNLSLFVRVLIDFVERNCNYRIKLVSGEMKGAIVTFVLMLLMIVFGAVLTSYTDDWEFLEGAYLTFVSVSTIGFGDYVVNDGKISSRSNGKTAAIHVTIFLITLGLCVVSSVICSVSAAIERRQKQMHMCLNKATNPDSVKRVINNLHVVSVERVHQRGESVQDYDK